MFTGYSRKVLDIIKELKLGNDSETWIKGLKCGIKAQKEIQYHYDGKSEGARMKQADRYNLKKLFYKNETNFTLEKYVTQIKGIFYVLGKYGVALYEY